MKGVKKMSKALEKMKEKQEGAVYWLEIAGGIMLVVIIIVLIRSLHWDTIVNDLYGAMSRMLTTVENYWSGTGGTGGAT